MVAEAIAGSADLLLANDVDTLKTRRAVTTPRRRDRRRGSRRSRTPASARRSVTRWTRSSTTCPERAHRSRPLRRLPTPRPGRPGSRRISACESLPGGEHPAWGTANRIVPLGPDYLELIGVADPDIAGVVGVRARRARRWRPARGLGRGDRRHRPGRRAPRGSSCSGARGRAPTGCGSPGASPAWRTPCAPAARCRFSSSRDGPAVLRPGGDPSAPAGISWVEVAGDEAALRAWLGGAELPVRFVSEGRGITAVGIGDRVLVYGAFSARYGAAEAGCRSCSNRCRLLARSSLWRLPRRHRPAALSSAPAPCRPGRRGKTTTVIQQNSPLGAAPSDTAATQSGLTARDIYKRDAPGVVYVRPQIVQQLDSPSTGSPRSSRAWRPARASCRQRAATSSPTPTSSRAPTKVTRAASPTARRVDAKVVGKDASTDLALLKVDPEGPRPQAARARRLASRPGRRPDDRDRQPVRPRPHAHHRRRVGAAAPDHRRRTASRSTTSSRPTPRSTPATPAAR